jgi:hypothetical protein
MAEYSLTTYHSIDFDGASKLGTATRYMDRLVREAIEIRLHPDNFNRDDGFNLSYAWRPIIQQRINGKSRTGAGRKRTPPTASQTRPI